MYTHLLVQSWIPALDGVEEKLKRGARVAEIGSGSGFALLQLARNYPQSTFVGFDSHVKWYKEAQLEANPYLWVPKK